MNNNHELDAIQVSLKSLRVEYEKYLNGANDLPPFELQGGVREEIRRVRSSLRSAADRFRFSTLESQFNTYSEMFNRRVRAREEGRELKHFSRVDDRKLDPKKGIRVNGSVGTTAASVLYQGLYTAANTKVDLESFRRYLDRQAALIRERTGCVEVQFRLAEENGAAKLKAKPVHN